MKIRTVYFKTKDMQKTVTFWRAVLNMDPHKTFDEWYEFSLSNINLGILKLEENEATGSNCVPVFELDNKDIPIWIDRAKKAGAVVTFDGLDDPNILSIVLQDPDGNEFEISKMHD